MSNLENKKTILVGTGYINIVNHIDVNKTTTIVKDRVVKKELNFLKKIQYTNPYIQLNDSEIKTLVCKGNKHQYREVTEKFGSLIYKRWICQCGKRL